VLARLHHTDVVPPLPPSTADRVALAQHPGTTAADLTALSAAGSPLVLAAVAANPSTPPDVLVRLAASGRRNIQRAVLTNTSAPPPALLALLRHAPREICWEVPLHPAADDDVYREAAGSSETRTRQAVAGQPDLPADVADALAQDPHHSVRGMLAERTSRPDVLAVLVVDPHRLVRAMAPRNPLLTTDQLRNLAHDPNADVRAAVAAAEEHPLPNDVAETLVADRSSLVRFNLATGGAPPRIKAMLWDDPDDMVATHARQSR